MTDKAYPNAGKTRGHAGEDDFPGEFAKVKQSLNLMKFVGEIANG